MLSRRTLLQILVYFSCPAYWYGSTITSTLSGEEEVQPKNAYGIGVSRSAYGIDVYSQGQYVGKASSTIYLPSIRK